MTPSTSRIPSLLPAVLLALCAACPSALPAQQGPTLTVHPSTLPRLTTIDERYLSYNIEMLEVTGGNFWKPYHAASTPAPESAARNIPAGMSASLYAYRAPKDLSNQRLRKLAAALGPAYLRVSGTWANSTYLPAADESITKPPAGFNGVLTRAQWKGVVDFARATDSEIVTSFATSAGTRDAHGLWTTDQAKRFLDYTRELHGHIAAAEYMNEPTFATLGGAPKGYTAEDYGADFKVFRAFLRANAPQIRIAGPGSVGESAASSSSIGGGNMPGFLPTPALLQATGHNTVDIFSYHSYAAVSQRCAAMKGAHTTTAADALSEDWLAQPDAILAFYRKLRDQYDPGKPLWNTETAEAACGGDLWASTFLDTFRYLDQLGRLARGGVKVVMHNTLAASDYGLLDETTYEPRPDYWAALLWRKMMGTTVLDAGVPLQHGLHVYAHCLRNRPGGVALLVIQNDTARAHTLQLPLSAQRYTLSAPKLESHDVSLNGEKLTLGSDDALPTLRPVSQPAGRATFAPATITFLTFTEANNPACR